MLVGKNISRFVLIAALGFFALVAQTLLFRDFLTVFEGNELGVSAFFTSWLLWIVVGAGVGLHPPKSPFKGGLAGFPWLTLLYLPAFAVQHGLVLQARSLAGVEAYEIFPFLKMLGVAMLVNAPVSFLTGFLFTRACKWAETIPGLPVARVYVCETVGGCVGGVLVTALLASGMPGEGVAIYAAWFLIAAASVVIMPGRALAIRGAIPILNLLVLGVALQGGVGQSWAEIGARGSWARLLPRETYQGAFNTAQARYLYGERSGQFIVVSGGAACESLPAGEHAAEVVALHLAQKPDARNVLVFGPDSLGVCSQFRAVPSIESVAWLHPDPAYPAALEAILESRAPLGAMPDAIPGVDIRAFARETDRRFDLIVLNLPNVTTLVLNRYCTGEFFGLLKNVLADGGVVSVRVSGGSNYLGGELAYLGSSMRSTLQSEFEHVAMKPGDETWLMASDADVLTERPAVLRERFAGIPGADRVYPDEGILALYPPDRIAFQNHVYERTIAEAGAPLLANTDTAPKALLFGLLLALRQAGSPALAKYVPGVVRNGVWLLAVPGLLYAALQWSYLRRMRRAAAAFNAFDAQFLVAATGFLGMAASIALMFFYQTRFGSLFLDIGLISALFMLGAFLGSAVVERILARSCGTGALACGTTAEGGCPTLSTPALLAGLFAAHVCFLIVLMVVGPAPERFGLPHVIMRVFYGALFVAAGIATGAYFPFGAYVLEASGRTVAASGSNLEMIDNLGGAAGALLAGLVLLPVLGGSAAGSVLLLLLTASAAPLLLRSRQGDPALDRFDRFVRPAAYILFGIAAYCLIASQIMTASLAALEGAALGDAAHEMAGDAEIQEEEGRLADGTILPYFSVADAPDRPGGYVFATGPWAAKFPGYAGPIVLAVHVDREGTLRDYRVVRSNETPAYLSKVEARKVRLMGRNIFAPDPFAGVDAVSGATLTNDAILRTLETAGRAFAAQVLGKDTGAAEELQRPSAYTLRNRQFRDFVCLVALMAAAVAMRFRPRKWPRRALLAVCVIVTGILLNLQYSTQHIMSLLSLNAGALAPTGACLLMVGLPVFVALFGNVYCGYLCPFGALQELIGDLAGVRIARNPGKATWRYGRAVKYVLLFLIVVLYAATRDYGVLGADPLVTAFGTGCERVILAFAGASLFLSLFFRRFWCRNLCPAGAFLSLVSGIRPLARFMPARQPHRCDLGVRTNADLDCIFCDRCNLPARAEEGMQPKSRFAFLAAVTIVAVAFVALTAPNVKIPTSSAEVQGRGGSAGKPRAIDVEQMKQLIRQQRLSGHEAEFYKPAAQPGELPPVSK